MKKRIILGVILLIILVFVYNLIVQIIAAVKSGDRLHSAVEVVYKLEVRNKELKKKLSGVQSPDFIEQEARDKLGLGKKGETLVIIPEKILKMVLGASSSSQLARLPNWLGWFKVFFK